MDGHLLAGAPNFEALHKRYQMFIKAGKLRYSIFLINCMILKAGERSFSISEFVAARDLWRRLDTNFELVAQIRADNVTFSEK